MATLHDDALTLQYDRSGAHLTVYVGGELDLTGAGTFADDVVARTGPHVRHVTLDVSTLAYCDSSGLNALVRIARHLQETGAQLTVYQPRAMVRHLLEITGVQTIVDIRG